MSRRNGKKSGKAKKNGKAMNKKKLTEPGARKQARPPTMPTQDPQDSSSFFQKLPLEIRLEIYSIVFCSTRLSFGKRTTCAAGEQTKIRLRPAPNSLGALRVCRRFSNEIGDSWLGEVLFSFDDPLTLLDKLTALDPQTLGKLRHMRYLCETALEEGPAFRDDPMGWVTRYRLPHFLGLLRGLNLDRLTVAGPSSAYGRYLELDALIKHSNGWKELCYLSKNSAMLGFEESDKSAAVFRNEPRRHGRRAPQPSTWTKALAARDGPTASVTINRSAKGAPSGFMMSKPSTRQAFADQVAEPGKESEYGVEPDTDLMTPGEEEKEILVVVKRGKGVDCTETGTSPMMQEDIRKCHPYMTWEVMRGILNFGDGDESDEDEDTDEFYPYFPDDFDDGFHFDFGSDPSDEDDEDPSHIYRKERAADMARIHHERKSRLQLDDRTRSSDGVSGPEVDEHGCPIKVDTYRHVDDY